jgi:hypothetical protein
MIPGTSPLACQDKCPFIQLRRKKIKAALARTAAEEAGGWEKMLGDFAPAIPKEDAP